MTLATRGRDRVLRHQEGEEVVVRHDLVDRGEYPVDGPLLTEHVDQFAFLGRGVVLLHEGGGVTELSVCLLLSREQTPQDVKVPVETPDRGEIEEQSRDLWRRPLPVAIDT